MTWQRPPKIQLSPRLFKVYPQSYKVMEQILSVWVIVYWTVCPLSSKAKWLRAVWMSIPQRRPLWSTMRWKHLYWERVGVICWGNARRDKKCECDLWHRTPILSHILLVCCSIFFFLHLNWNGVIHFCHWPLFLWSEFIFSSHYLLSSYILFELLLAVFNQ